MSVALSFHVFRGESFVREVLLEKEVVKIGRAESAHLRLDDPAVSRMHAVIEAATKDEIAIIDLGSSEGTRVNGRKVAKTKLVQGDEIWIGPFRILLELAKTFVAPPVPASLFSPEPPPAAMECPRCRGAIVETEVGGGVYRDLPSVRSLRCAPCAVTFLDVAKLAQALGRPGLRLSGSAADRGHEPTRTGCPSCLASMQEVTLSWAGFWVVLEECPRCGMIVLDEGETEMIGRLAEEIQDTDAAAPASEPETWLRTVRGMARLLEGLSEGTQ